MEQNEKELLENLKKCRCCLRLLLDDRRAVEINDVLRNQFFEITQIILLENDMFASRICQMCATDMQTFESFRKDLRNKQLSLYKLANIAFEFEEVPPQNQADSESLYEGIDQEDEEEYIEESPIQDCDEDTQEKYSFIGIIEEDSNPNDAEVDFDEDVCSIIPVTDSDSTMLKIEKVGVDSKITEDSMDWTNDTKTECEICDVEISVNHVDEHNELMHQPNIECSACDKKFQSKISLSRHINETHEQSAGKTAKAKRKLHYCGLCDRVYDYKKHLDDHVRSFHNRERNSQCSICLKRFYHRDLKKHIEHVHGEKNITCNICGKQYTCMENLKLHLRYHEEPKFTCSFENCGKRFHQKILYENHLLKHSQTKAISCSDCGTSFYTPRDLKRHIQRVHMKVSRKCFGCETVFGRKDKYRDHVIKYHKELSDDERNAVLAEIKSLKWNEQ